MAAETNRPDSSSRNGSRSASRSSALLSPPELSVAKGGGAMKGLGEGFRANPATGSASFSIPLPLSPGRGGTAPALSLSYDSSSANGPFGLGWSLDLPSIARQTSRRLPLYDDSADSDTFSLSGFEDLVPVEDLPGIVDEGDFSYRVRRYRPRSESSFSRIERWSHVSPKGQIPHWRIYGSDGTATHYGDTSNSRIADPGEPSKVFRWLASRQNDSIGNAVCYRYIEDGAQRYLGSVLYGNRASFFQGSEPKDYHFELSLQYESRPDQPVDRRAGFPVPLAKRCREIRMTHRFGEPSAPVAEIVRSLAFEYRETSCGFSLLVSATQTGHRGEESESLPPLAFEYSGCEEWNASWQDFSREHIGDIPGGLASAKWIDLWGEGLPGILSERFDGWYYKRNLGSASFAPSKLVSPKPRPGTAAGLLDLEGDGDLWLAEYAGAGAGASRLDAEGCWSRRKAFRQCPNIDFGSPRARFVDLDGDGRAELVLDEHSDFVCYPSEGSDGYGNPVRISKMLGAPESPPAGDERPQFAARGKDEAIFIADMTGDGIPDIVRARAGEVCYWPGLGHGRFGKRIAMGGFKGFDAFHPDRVQFANIDGIGGSDIIYTTYSGSQPIARVWLNRSGHSLREAKPIPLPGGAGSRLEAVDLMGSGVMCLVWSSAMPEDAGRPPKYLDLLRGRKPCVIVSARNGMGREARLEYAPSTKFYLEDRASGEPWATRLPYPVQCLSRVETLDLATGWSHASRYGYHHGCHDGSEREFRGFGRVDRIDSEAGCDPVADQAPVLAKTWFHLGVAPDGRWLPDAFSKEYWSPEAAGSDSVSRPPDLGCRDLSPQEWREAHRAFKGLAIREEVCGMEGVPYLVTDRGYAIERHGESLTQKDRFHPATVWQATERESASRHHEKDEADPRIARSLVLEADKYGRPALSAEAVCGRQAGTDYAEQMEAHIVIKETRYAADVETAEVFRMGLECASKTWELTGLGVSADAANAAELRQAFADATEIPFEAEPSQGTQKRLVEHTETLFYDENLAAALPLGKMAAHGLPYESYSLAYTPGLLAHIYKNRIDNPAMLAEGGFKQREDGNWWARSGRNIYDAGATSNFYLPSKVKNAFGGETTLAYDDYNLLIASVTDPLRNTVTAENDYRTLSPRMLTDPNGNRTAIETDALGIVVKTAAMGKEGGSDGDTLEDPTARMEYGFAEFGDDGRLLKPSWVKTFSRETHGDENTRWLQKIEYSDGMGNIALAKATAEPGEGGRPRWVGTGRTVLNNKGNPVKQYEPYFSGNDGWESEPEMREQGVTPILHYDPLSRLTRTDFPDGTHSKAEFTAWEQRDYDRCDTAAGSPHYDTPTVTHLDSLGRAFCVIADDGTNHNIATRTVLDIEGNEKKIIDARDKTVMEYRYGIHGEKCRSKSMDAGKRWMLTAADGLPVYAWDSRGHRLHTEYDELRRPVKQLLDDEKLAGETVYGEAAENPEANNLRGQLWKIYDQSGMTENVKYDFKGNLLESRRQFAQEYKNTIDWSKKPALESEEFASMTEYDALNRATSIKTPRSSGEIIPAYDDGGLLKTVKAKLRKSAQATEFVAGITYNPKGQRERITYGNGATTRYDYDDKTFRLKQLLSTRSGGADALQDLSYEYDQMGNITKITDNAQQAIYFNGQVVNPSQTFEYDALYRLTKAAGREHASINADSEPEIEGYNPAALSPEDGSAMRLYAREWEYDSVGNILQLIHKANNNSWTRNYNYDNTSNRLLSTEVGNAAVKYTYNEHGSMATTPHLQAMTWDFAERLSHITRGTTEAYYNYDGTGQRVRKTVEKGNVVEERLYLGGFEIFRKMNGNSLELERETLHIMDDVKRIAVVETKTVDNGTAVDNPAPIQRYQLSNNIESATLELDENASVISYEEYYPYGETSYRAGKNIAEVGLKRYRYTGKEKDEESGLYYYGARYYICWLGRWTAADPAGLVDGLNLYMYCRGSPVGLRDPNGNAPEDDKQMKSIPSSAYGAKSSSMAVDGLDDSINESQEREVSKYLYINGQKASGIIDKEISLNKINVDHGGYIYLEEGDNLADITKQINKEYSTTFSVDDIAKFNNIENADKVKTGDKIALPKMELFFDLKTLKVVDATYGDIPGLSWGGTSGKPGFQSQEFQSRKDKGPIPEGSYMLGNTQSYTPATSFLRKSLEKAGITNWEGTATMGGTDTWGTIRTWLEPMSGTDTYGRGGFSIHGGKEPGSAGCIDLTNMNNEFHNWLKSYAKPIILKVKYEAL